MKYCPEFPERFGSLQDARSFSESFFSWYNKEHRHSGIAMLTPEMVHYGRAEAVLAARHLVLEVAYRKHPERFRASAARTATFASGRLDQSTGEGDSKFVLWSKCGKNFARI